MNESIPPVADGDEGWGVSTMTYRKIIWNLYHVKGDMPYDLQKYYPECFKQIAGSFWWISPKWFERFKNTHCRVVNMDGNEVEL